MYFWITYIFHSITKMMFILIWRTKLTNSLLLAHLSRRLNRAFLIKRKWVIKIVSLLESSTLINCDITSKCYRFEQNWLIFFDIARYFWSIFLLLKNLNSFFGKSKLMNLFIFLDIYVFLTENPHASHKLTFLGHLSHSGDQLQLVFVRRHASCVNNWTFLTF